VRVERIERGCSLAVDVERTDKFLLLRLAVNQQGNRQTRVDPDSLGGLNEFRPPMLFVADHRAHRRAVPRGFQARTPA
jgi:hypothetical protein